jgi:hypothetical protein
MPQFCAEYIPSNRGPSWLEEFAKGYFECAEWLLPDTDGEYGGIDRNKIRGWSVKARKQMLKDCRDFVRANAADLGVYCAVTGRSMACAGHDFYLTREGHGAGFWDHGGHPVLTALTKASRVFGEFGYPYLHRGFIFL